MKCHFCVRTNPKWKEETSQLTFCNRFCQIGYHFINGHNPLELKDTTFLILLQVPPSKLFKMARVSKRFKNILENNEDFKRRYVAAWEVTDEFYLLAKYYHPDWLPFLRDAYNGYLLRSGNKEQIFTAAMINGRVDIVALMLRRLPIDPSAIRWGIVNNLTNYEILAELFKYKNPTNDDLIQAVIANAELRVIQLFLDTRAITDVTSASRLAATFGNNDVVQVLEEYDENYLGEQGIPKRRG